MSGNSLGLLFSVTSFGESHGPAIGCGGWLPSRTGNFGRGNPAGAGSSPGTSRHVTQRKEPDTVEILSGVFEGKTTGAPIGLLIRNQDQRSQDYSKIAETFRPGHADYTYWQKYGIRDYRGGGRSSARETAGARGCRCHCQKWLKQRYGIEIRGCMTQIGDIEIRSNPGITLPTMPFCAERRVSIGSWMPIWTRFAASAIRSAQKSRGGRKRAGRLGRFRFTTVWMPILPTR